MMNSGNIDYKKQHSININININTGYIFVTKIKRSLVYVYRMTIRKLYKKNKKWGLL